MTPGQIIQLAADALRESRIDLSQGRLFGNSSGIGSQGGLFGGNSSKPTAKPTAVAPAAEGHWVTIHGAHILIRHGEDVGAKLREHFAGTGKKVSHEHVAGAARQVKLQGGRPNVHPDDQRAAVAPKAPATAPPPPPAGPPTSNDRVVGVVDPNRQFSLVAKDAEGNPVEVGEKPGQAALFGNTDKPPAPPATPKNPDAALRAKFDERAPPSMFGPAAPAAKSGRVVETVGYAPVDKSKKPGEFVRFHESVDDAVKDAALGLQIHRPTLKATLLAGKPWKMGHATYQLESAPGASAPAGANVAAVAPAPASVSPAKLAAMDAAISRTRMQISIHEARLDRKSPERDRFKDTVLDPVKAEREAASHSLATEKDTLFTQMVRRRQYAAGTHDHEGRPLDREPAASPPEAAGNGISSHPRTATFDHSEADGAISKVRLDDGRIVDQHHDMKVTGRDHRGYETFDVPKHVIDQIDARDAAHKSARNQVTSAAAAHMARLQAVIVPHSAKVHYDRYRGDAEAADRFEDTPATDAIRAYGPAIRAGASVAAQPPAGVPDGVPGAEPADTFADDDVVSLRGSSYPHRHKLRSAGFRWNDDAKTWVGRHGDLPVGLHGVTKSRVSTGENKATFEPARQVLQSASQRLITRQAVYGAKKAVVTPGQSAEWNLLDQQEGQALYEAVANHPDAVKNEATVSVQHPQGSLHVFPSPWKRGHYRARFVSSPKPTSLSAIKAAAIAAGLTAQIQTVHLSAGSGDVVYLSAACGIERR